jgi:hypothetical protein
MKRPSFQFYPGDWLNDVALRMVSAGARGLWIDMMCIMHQGSDYGYLKVNGKVILTPNLARMTGSTSQEAEGYLSELEAAGVFSRDEYGCIFSRRMIRDEKVREARAAGGSKGGNPALMGKNKDNLPPNLPPTPSSSSSSSVNSPSESKGARASRLPTDWQPSDEDMNFCKAERPDLDVGDVAAQFRDYWIAKSGRDATKKDWPATWRNWVRRQQAPRAPPSRPSYHDERAATIAGLTGEDRRYERDGRTIDV